MGGGGGGWMKGAKQVFGKLDESFILANSN